jgi:hypothetical protein
MMKKSVKLRGADMQKQSWQSQTIPRDPAALSAASGVWNFQTLQLWIFLRISNAPI